MLLNISIQNFIIIDRLNLNFNSFFTAITGETGTGKSIIIDAIDFCFGKFSAKNVKKVKDEITSISLTFKLDDVSKIEEAVGFNVTNYITITKILDGNNKTIVSINDKQISYKIMKDLYALFIDVTAQFDSILDKNSHIGILDKFMISKNPKMLEKLSEVSRFCTEIQNTDKKISKIEEDLRILRRDREYYLQIVEDLKLVEIKENEETELLARRSEISKLYASNNSIKSALESLQSIPMESKISQSIKILEKIDNQKIIDVKDRLNSISFELSDTINELTEINESLFVSESELLEIDDRLSVIRSLARKYNTPTGVLFEFLQSAQEKLENVDNIDEELLALIKHRSEILSSYILVSSDISSNRKEFAKVLSEDVCERLSELLMPNATFKIEVIYSEHKIANYGQDGVEFLANFNKKISLMPMTQIASGGEAARLNFALKIVMGMFSTANTIIFDEVDIGIGGAAAYAMGSVMRKTSEFGTIQIISITHSPQVAARSLSHIVITKEVHGNEIKVLAGELSMEERVCEIARMISGAVITDDAILAAKQLIN